MGKRKEQMETTRQAGSEGGVKDKAQYYVDIFANSQFTTKA